MRIITPPDYMNPANTRTRLLADMLMEMIGKEPDDILVMEEIQPRYWKITCRIFDEDGQPVIRVSELGPWKEHSVEISVEYHYVWEPS